MHPDPALLPLDPAQAVWLLVWVPLVALIHEAGHALAARPAGYRLVSFGVGLGPPLLRHPGKGGAVYYLGRWLFAGGACVAVPRTLSPGPRAMLFHAGGGLAQLALAGALALVPDTVWWVAPVRTFNLLVLAWNLLPWRWGGKASDGWWLVAHLRGAGRGPGLLFSRRAPLERILAFETQVGSPMGMWYARLMLAWSDLQVGALDRVDAFFTAENTEAALDASFDAIHHALTAEWHRQRGRPLAAMWAVREVRRARGASLTEDADGMLSLVEARTLRDLGERGRARQALARLAGAGGPVAADAALLRLELAVDAGSLAEIELAASRLVDHARGADLSPATRVGALWSAGLALAATDRGEVGRSLQHRARREAARLLALAVPDDRGSLVRALGPAAGLVDAGAAGQDPPPADAHPALACRPARPSPGTDAGAQRAAAHSSGALTPANRTAVGAIRAAKAAWGEGEEPTG